MEFLKKHYEKIILSVVLLGLAAAAALMPQRVSEAQQKVDELKAIMVPPSVKERPPLNLETNKSMLARMQRGSTLELSLPHYVFNPVRWDRKPGGIIKIDHPDAIGPRAVTVVSINPLYLVVSMMGVMGTEENLRYQVSVVRETDSTPRPKTLLLRPGERNNNDLVTLKEVKGPKEAPTEFVLELTGMKQTISVTKDAPFKLAIGYSADLKYELRNKSWKQLKRGSKLQIENENYKIIEISETEVVLSNDSTFKRTTIAHQSAQNAQK